MSTTVLGALQNARCNFETVERQGLGAHPIYLIAMEQLRNAIKSLENGRAPNEVIQDHMFGEVDTGTKER